jgi:ribosomal protein S2
MESSYIAEIAQHVAMNNSMDVWVGGSLRNWKWYEIELNRIREQHSQYRIAIITISAPDEMIENNIMKRAAETGREIPQEL